MTKYNLLGYQNTKKKKKFQPSTQPFKLYVEKPHYFEHMFLQRPGFSLEIIAVTRKMEIYIPDKSSDIYIGSERLQPVPIYIGACIGLYLHMD